MSPSILQKTLTAAFCWLLLVPVLTYASDDNKSLTAVLLNAGPDISDPFFGDSVVLVMNNLGPAPIGIIINRPTAVPVAQLFPGMKRLVKLQDKVYFGGPIESESVWFLFRTTAPPHDAIKVLDGICLSADRPLLLKLLKRDKPLDGLRIFIGHAGWAPGQLEEEIASGAWTLEHASPDALFKGQSEHPWPSEPSTPELPKHRT